MNDTTDKLAESYDRAQASGRGYLSRSWQRLSGATRMWLVQAGHYTDHGKHTGLAYGEGDSRVDDLEYAVGKLHLCIDTKLPPHTEAGAPIPPEAVDSEVMTAVSTLLYHPFGKAPTFLRLAMVAIRQQQMAELLCRMPIPKAVTLLGGLSRIVFGILTLLMLLTMPAMLASALIAAFKGDSGGTVAALYGLGFAVWTFWVVKQMEKKTKDPGTPDEQAYNRWLNLGAYGIHGEWTATGAGAKAFFEDMLRRSLPFPLIAIDVADALQATQQRDDGSPT